MMMEAVRTSETSVDNQFTRQYNPEDSSELLYTVSTAPPVECRDSTLKPRHDRFLPNPFHFAIHLSPYHSTLHNLLLKNATQNKLQINTIQ
jgi:hypothetical protein